MPLQLVCFDMDQTILKGHLHHSLMMAGVLPGSADTRTIEAHLEKMGGIKNRDLLLATMRDLLKAGKKIAITSFTSYPETIAPILRQIGLEENEIAQIKIFCGTPSQESMFLEGKNPYISKAMAAFGIDEPSDVLLADDSRRNIEIAQTHGCGAIHVTEQEGQVNYLNSLRHVAELPPLGAGQGQNPRIATAPAQRQK